MNKQFFLRSKLLFQNSKVFKIFKCSLINNVIFHLKLNSVLNWYDKMEIIPSNFVFPLMTIKEPPLKMEYLKGDCFSD